jgi:hypothetical protein
MAQCKFKLYLIHPHVKIKQQLIYEPIDLSLWAEPYHLIRKAIKYPCTMSIHCREFQNWEEMSVYRNIFSFFFWVRLTIRHNIVSCLSVPVLRRGNAGKIFYYKSYFIKFLLWFLSWRYIMLERKSMTKIRNYANTRGLQFEFVCSCGPCAGVRNKLDLISQLQRAVFMNNLLWVIIKISRSYHIVRALWNFLLLLSHIML